MAKWSIILGIVSSILLPKLVYSQLKIDAEFRPRFEYRHGYKYLAEKNSQAAAFISQRSRLNLNYRKDQFDFYISLQDVRVWGDNPQLIRSDQSGLSLHQIWTKVKLSNHFNLKVGRQEIILNDHRIFGNVDWMQQARSHDAISLDFKKGKWESRLFATYNQDEERFSGSEQYISNNYRTFQALWLNKKFENTTISFLFLNNGLQQSDSSRTNFSQTFGTHLNSKHNKHQVLINAFLQKGKDKEARKLDAFLVALEWNYEIISKRLSYSIGSEWISGNKSGLPNESHNNAFTPFYGTNHKFNGFMDYFFVGNHYDKNGLLNAYQKVEYNWKSTNQVKIYHHEFWSGGNQLNSDKAYFGSEVDVVYRKKISEEASISFTYCHFFPGNSLKDLHQVQSSITNNYGFITFRFKPELFNTIESNKTN